MPKNTKIILASMVFLLFAALTACGKPSSQTNTQLIPSVSEGTSAASTRDRPSTAPTAVPTQTSSSSKSTKKKNTAAPAKKSAANPTAVKSTAKTVKSAAAQKKLQQIDRRIEELEKGISESKAEQKKKMAEAKQQQKAGEITPEEYDQRIKDIDTGYGSFQEVSAGYLRDLKNLRNQLLGQ